MRLLALHLTNVRKFTGKRASITGIGEGITVVSEANEFGKSTFFDAVHALFFEKYSSSARAVKSLQPYAGGAIEVAADVRTDQGVFRVEKRFLARKSAKVTRLSDGVTVAQEDEAERWISALLGSAGDGPAGLLWVRQGLVGLEPEQAKDRTNLLETRRDLLSSVAGEIDAMTGGRRMDRVMRRVAEALAALTTKTGRKAGVWKAAADEAEMLAGELAQVSAQVQSLEAALIGRKEAEAALGRLDNPDARARRDAALATAKAAMEEARAHVAAVAAARQEHDLARLKAKAAQSELDVLLQAFDALKTAEEQARSCTEKADAAAQEVRRLKAVQEAAQEVHVNAAAGVTAARRQLDLTRRQITARRARAEMEQLADRIGRAEVELVARDAARALAKASLATPDWLARVEEAQTEVARHSAAVDAQATSLEMEYSGAARVTLNGADVAAKQRIALDGENHLDLPGIGRMTILAQGSGADGKARLAKAVGALEKLLEQAGAATLADARGLAAERAGAETKATLAQAVLDTLAPKGIEALRSAKADADLAAAEAHDATLPDIAELEAGLTRAEDAENVAAQARNDAGAAHAAGRETAVKHSAAAETAQRALDQAIAAAGPVETRDSRRAGRLHAQAAAQEQAVKAETDLQGVLALVPDMATVTAGLKRAEDAVTAARQERAQVELRLAALSSEIRTLAGSGLEEHRDALAGQLETARSNETRFAREAAALSRLQTALDAERNAARDTYFGPVQEELKPLLAILHRDAALSFDSESLLPSGLLRDESEETLDDLSGGTKEQIAILTRLAFARLFARQGRHMPIILDDALVYSDDDRIIRMFTALTRAAQDQQIIVFSCRQLAFQDLGGTRPVLTVTDA